MKYRDLPKIGFVLVAGGLVLGACSTERTQNPALNQARASVSAANSNADVARYGTYPLAEARENLATSQDAWANYDPQEKVTHYANMARTQSEIAATVAKRRSIQAEMVNAARQVTLGDMLFKVGKADLNPRGEQAVAQLGTFLKSRPDRNVALIGYTDSTGSAKLNAKLSQERADTVKSALVKEGVPAERIAATGRGPANPVASNDTPEGRQKNRRVIADIASPDTTGMGSTSPTH